MKETNLKGLTPHDSNCMIWWKRKNCGDSKKGYQGLAGGGSIKRHYFANESPSSQGYGFSCAHVWM